MVWKDFYEVVLESCNMSALNDYVIYVHFDILPNLTIEYFVN